MKKIAKTIKFTTTTEARKNISDIVNDVKYANQVYAIGRRNKIEALIFKFPENFNSNLSEISNTNANSSSFNFLRDEPELYSINDLKKKYV
jgi:hypothetical protein